MRIGIDARPLIEKKTGIGYYLKYLLENILENDKINEYILFSDREIFFDTKNYKNLKLVVDKESVYKKTLWYLLSMKKMCKNYKVDVFWGTQHVLPLGLKKVKTILTIHDLVAFDFKDTMNSYNKIINKLLIPRSIRKADRIIAVSNSTKERIKVNFSDLSSNKIHVIYEDVVVKRQYEAIEKSYLKDNGLKEKEFLMFLGTIEPRKNIKTLIKALDEINSNTSMKLVICGKYGWNCDEEKRLIEENKDKIVFLDYITEEEKDYLMNKCFAFIFPSIYEGFGLPVLEAMRNNSVVLVADNTSLKEIVEYKTLRFNTLDEKDLANKVINLYKNPEIYKEAMNYCNKREKEFNWKDISSEYIKRLTCWNR